MIIRYLGQELSDKNISRLRVLQEIVFGEIYIKPESKDHWWLAFQEGRPVGFASLTIYEEVETAFLSLAGVIPCARGQGLQKKFVAKREALAKKLDCQRIISYTSRDNIVSANNLIKAGYLLYTPNWEWGVSEAFYFQKVLRHEKSSE